LAVAARVVSGLEQARLQEPLVLLAQSSFKNFTDARGGDSPIVLLSGIRWCADATAPWRVCVGKRQLSLCE
jgi:hypothetical protein